MLSRNPAAGGGKHHVQHAGQGEGAEHDGNEGNAAHKVDAAEGEAGVAHIGVHADAGGEHAERRGNDALERILRADGAHEEQTHGREQEEFRRAELDDEGSKQRHEQQHGQSRHHAAGEGRDIGNEQGVSCLALSGHGIAVEGGDHGRGGSGRVQQNGRYGTAVFTAHIHAGKGDERRGMVHGIGQRENDDHTNGRAETRQCSDHDTQRNGNDERQHINGAETGKESAPQHF